MFWKHIIFNYVLLKDMAEALGTWDNYYQAGEVSDNSIMAKQIQSEQKFCSKGAMCSIVYTL